MPEGEPDALDIAYGFYLGRPGAGLADLTELLRAVDRFGKDALSVRCLRVVFQRRAAGDGFDTLIGKAKELRAAVKAARPSR